MFFIFSINSKQINIPMEQSLIIHDNCSKFGRYEPFYLVDVLSIFFIPILKWNKRFFVRMSCCGEIYELDKQVGKNILSGKTNTILKEDLTSLSKNFYNNKVICTHCGFESDNSDLYCRKCGHKLNH